MDSPASGGRGSRSAAPVLRRGPYCEGRGAPGPALLPRVEGDTYSGARCSEPEEGQTGLTEAIRGGGARLKSRGGGRP